MPLARGGLRRAGEVLAGIGLLLHGAIPRVRCQKTSFISGKPARIEDMDVGSEQIGDAGDDADRLEGRGLGRAAAAGDRRPCVGADDGDGLDFGRVERQNVAFVLEQRDAFERALQRNGAIGNGVGGVGGIELRAVGEAVAQLGAQQAQHLVVDGGFLHRAVLDRGQQGFWRS